MENNPIIVLSELVQKEFGSNILTSVVKIDGDDHCPVVTVRIVLPNGAVFTASGKNKRIAKQKAAKRCLEQFYS